MSTQASNDRRMYSGTPCDECGGPTIQLHGGSIWCGAEDPHPGGHFVTRVAFERSPLKGEFKPVAYGAAKPVKPRVIAPPKPKTSPFAGGFDDFVGSDER